MADTVRAFAFYWRDKKSAMVNQTNFKIMPGRTAMFGAEGYLVHSKGAVQCRIEINEVIPIAGSASTQDVEQYVIAQHDIEVGIIVGGKFFRVAMAITEADYTSNTETGKCEGKIVLEGGIPKVTG